MNFNIFQSTFAMSWMYKLNIQTYAGLVLSLPLQQCFVPCLLMSINALNKTCSLGLPKEL